MGFAVMSMTETAATRVKAIVENSGSDAMGIRVGIKKGGCAGMEYTIDMVTEPNQTSACGCGESVELKPADLAALAARGDAVVPAH
jgi:iron-sulfur cluster assembly protein